MRQIFGRYPKRSCLGEWPRDMEQLEDSLYLNRGEKLRGNGAAVEKVVRIAAEVGREIAAPAQARAMIGLPEVPNSY